MKCINSHMTLPSPVFSKYNHQNWLPNRRNSFSLVSLRTQALPSYTFLATTLPSAGKLSVLLQTGGVCLFAYWVANFVVPGIIFKDLQSNETNDGSPPEEDER